VERLRAAGVEATFEVVPGAPHGITSWAFDTSIVRDYIRRALAWLGRMLETQEAREQTRR
jgi:hypothetical protein